MPVCLAEFLHYCGMVNPHLLALKIFFPLFFRDVIRGISCWYGFAVCVCGEAQTLSLPDAGLPGAPGHRRGKPVRTSTNRGGPCSWIRWCNIITVVILSKVSIDSMQSFSKSQQEFSAEIGKLISVGKDSQKNSEKEQNWRTYISWLQNTVKL